MVTVDFCIIIEVTTAAAISKNTTPKVPTKTTNPNSSPATIPHKPTPPLSPFVWEIRIQLGEYTYIPNHDYCDFMWGKCDTKLDIQYLWTANHT